MVSMNGFVVCVCRMVGEVSVVIVVLLMNKCWEIMLFFERNEKDWVCLGEVLWWWSVGG